MINQPTLLTVNEAADFLLLKRSTIYNWVHRRKIPYRHHGRKLIFDKNDLIKWSEAQKVDHFTSFEFDENSINGKNGVARKKCSLKIENQTTGRSYHEKE